VTKATKLSFCAFPFLLSVVRRGRLTLSEQGARVTATDACVTRMLRFVAFYYFLLIFEKLKIK
jgi:hypothetical protein